MEGPFHNAALKRLRNNCSDSALRTEWTIVITGARPGRLPARRSQHAGGMGIRRH
jgi:hypothetical protein